MYICVMDISFVSVSVTFRLYFGTVLKVLQEVFEDTKGVIRNRKSRKKRQGNVSFIFILFISLVSNPPPKMYVNMQLYIVLTYEQLVQLVVGVMQVPKSLDTVVMTME